MYPNEQNFYTSIYVHIDFEHYQYVLSMNQCEQDQLKNIYQLIVMHSQHKLIHNHSKMTKVGCLYPRYCTFDLVLDVCTQSAQF